MSRQWNKRFLASTRGQVVSMLRLGPRTVDELAQSLQLTDNAIRAHLTGLERDGLVVQEGQRRGTGKPAFVYTVTPEAEHLFPKAYEMVLDLLLDVLGEQVPSSMLDDLMREAGWRLAGGQTVPSGDLRARVEGAVQFLSDVGGVATAEDCGDGFIIEGRRCPLGAVVGGHPEVCLMAESLLREIIGSPVRQTCDPEVPRCRFVVDDAPTLGAAGSRETV